METCDEQTIPAVDNATHEIHRFMTKNATTIPSSLREFFSVPGYVNVTYICEEGYRLQDPNKNMIGCKYVTTPRKLGWRDHETVAAKAVWTRTDGIMCEKGEKTIH